MSADNTIVILKTPSLHQTHYEYRVKHFGGFYETFNFDEDGELVEKGSSYGRKVLIENAR